VSRALTGFERGELPRAASRCDRSMRQRSRNARPGRFREPRTSTLSARCARLSPRLRPRLQPHTLVPSVNPVPEPSYPLARKSIPVNLTASSVSPREGGVPIRTRFFCFLFREEAT
jgi:hypothetical protein